MAVLTGIVRQLLTMALEALPVMAAVLLARLLLRKAPRKFSMVLWLAVALRLICPVLPESPVGLVQTERAEQAVSVLLETPQTAAPRLPAPSAGGEESGGASGHAAGARPPAEHAAAEKGGWLPVLSLLWLAGFAAMAGWMLLGWLRLRRLVSAAVRRERDVWECDGLPSPFVMGLLRPRIYVPFRLTDAQRTYVMAHERHHIRRGDPWWKLLGCGILAVYWWDPAVWLCWSLFCRDLEMSCDEAVLDQLGDQARRGYSLSLVDFAQARRFPAALAFGEHDAARRVKNVLRWKRATPAVAALAMAAVLLVVSVGVHNARAGDESAVTLAAAEDGGVEISVRASEQVRSWALLKEVYQDGRLVSSAYQVFDGFADQGDGVTERSFRCTLRTEVPQLADGGFAGELTVSCAGASQTLPLPHQRYTGVGVLVGEDDRTRFRLKPGESVDVCTVLLSTGPDGAITFSAEGVDPAQRNSAAVRYRLVLSEKSFMELEAPPLDLAQTLYDLRVPSRKEMGAVRTLADALGMERFGLYTIVEYEQAIELAYFEPMEEWEETLLWKRAMVLLALISDADEVDVSFPAADGASRYTYYCGLEQPDGWAQALDYEDLKEMGRSPQGVRELLDYLDVEETEGGLTEKLWAAGDDPVSLLRLLDPSGALGRCTVDTPFSGCLRMIFQDAALTSPERDTRMWKYSMVLLALLEDYDQTSWNWLDDGVQAFQKNAGLWNTASWLEERGMERDIRAYGRSEEDLRLLVDALKLPEGGEAESLFAEMPETFMFCSGAGAWRTMLHVKPDGSFSGTFEDADLTTRTLCDFQGRFTEPMQVDGDTYSMEIAELTLAQTPGTEEERDGYHYIYKTPYGLEGAEELRIFRPGTPMAELPEGFLDWTGWTSFSAPAEFPETLPCWGIYNVTRQQGFLEYSDRTMP